MAGKPEGERERHHSEDLDVDMRIMLELIIGK
jgi:hypothetical protein